MLTIEIEREDLEIIESIILQRRDNYLNDLIKHRKERDIHLEEEFEFLSYEIYRITKVLRNFKEQK